MNDLQYFERAGLFMHGGNTHGCESWHVIGQCSDKEFHKFVDRIIAWRKERDLGAVKVEVVKEWFKKFIEKNR